MTVTLDGLTTAAGAGAAALLVMTLTQVLKAGLPALFDRITGATMSFALLAVLYAVAAVVLGVTGTLGATPVDVTNGLLALLVAWVTSAVAALGIHSVANNGARTFVQSAQPDSPPEPK